MKRENHKIAKATSIMGLATILSRIGGLVRDMVVASLFGAGFATDAFFMAFTIPNLLRRFFAEGSLTAAFVPAFTEVYQKKGLAEARKMASACWTLLLLVVVVVTVAGIFFSPWIVKGIGYGFSSFPEKLVLTNSLNRLMFPYLLCISLLAVYTGVLNVLGHFFLPSVSTLLLNISMISWAFFAGDYFDPPIMALAMGVLCGGILQLLLPVPLLMKKGILPGFSFDFRAPEVVDVARRMLPGIAGVAIYQINVVVTRLLASFLPEGSVSWLYYGQRLFEFPQGIFIVALGQAVLPAMSRQVTAGDEEGLRESVGFSLSLVLLITLPAIVGLVLCAEPIFSLLFMRGSFSLHDVQQSAYALSCYAPGLLFVGYSRMATSLMYSRKNTSTPVKISFWTFLVNVVLGLVLMNYFAHTGLAAALTLSALFNSCALFYCLRNDPAMPGFSFFAGDFSKILIATSLMGVLVYGLMSVYSWTAPGHTATKILFLSGIIAAGILLYFVSIWVLRVQSLRMLKTFVRKETA